jgi:sarcosine oxidase subunit beta
VTGVRANRGEVAAPIVILAAGAWTAPLVREAGIELPVWGVRHQVVHLKPPADVSWPFPGTGDPENALYFRPEAGGLVLAANSGPDDYPGEPECDPGSFDPTASEWYERWILRRLQRRVPTMARAEIVGGHAGVYPKGPDDFPLLGALPGLEGLYVVCDTSGGGMTSSPGLARAMAETIVRGETFTDLTPFRPGRFAEGQRNAEPYRLAPAGRVPWDG